MKFLLKLFKFVVNEVREMKEVDAVYFSENFTIGGGKLDEYNFETEEA